MAEPSVEYFNIRTPHGEWAEICMVEATGTFMAYSSFGTFAHHWPAIGLGVPLREFLRTLEFGYFFGKVSSTRGRVFCAESTRRGLKALVLEQRRSEPSYLSADHARHAYDAIGEIVSENVDEFFNHLVNDSDIWKVTRGDYSDVARHVRDPQCEGFWREIWPRFLERIGTPTPAEVERAHG